MKKSIKFNGYHFFGLSFLGWFKINAITLYPFVFYKQTIESVKLTTIAHECVHIDQVQSLGWVRFYFVYMLEYSYKRLFGFLHLTAYRTIGYESAAYSKQHFPKYKSMAKKVRKGVLWKKNK